MCLITLIMIVLLSKGSKKILTPAWQRFNVHRMATETLSALVGPVYFNHHLRLTHWNQRKRKVLTLMKNLSIVSGLCLRYSYGFQETIKRLHDGALGELRALQANDYRGPIWVKPRKPEWTDMEWHMRNWYYFTWLCGDFNVEQHVHFLDVCAWIMKNEYPISAVGMGGRQVRTAPEYGNIYDHHAVTYEYANGTKLYSNCRQQTGCRNDMSCHVLGAKGTAEISEQNLTISTGNTWTYAGKKNNIYQTEHDELFAAIAKGEYKFWDAERGARSSMTSILGRMATYSGQNVEWDKAINSNINIMPTEYAFNATPPVLPNADGFYPVPEPGQTKFF